MYASVRPGSSNLTWVKVGRELSFLNKKWHAQHWRNKQSGHTVYYVWVREEKGLSVRDMWETITNTFRQGLMRIENPQRMIIIAAEPPVIAGSLSGSKGSSFSNWEFVRLRNKGIERLPHSAANTLSFHQVVSKETGLLDFLCPVMPLYPKIKKES